MTKLCALFVLFPLALLAGPAHSQNSARGGTWKILAPTMRAGASIIYDPVRNRLILFGGSDNLGYRNDIWELSLSGPPVWHELQPLGPTPPPSSGHSAIYDPIRDRMIVFGGYYERLPCGSCGLELVPNQGTWALSLSGPATWSALDPAGVSPADIWRRFHTAIYDPLADRMIVYGGDRSGVTLDDLWSLSFETMVWTQLTPTPTPGGRAHHVAVLDPVRDRMLVFGCSASCGSQGEVWALSLLGPPAWTKIVPTGASLVKNIDGAAAVYEPVHDRVVVRVLGQPQVWALSLSGTIAWNLLAPSGDEPAAGGSAIYDVARGRMIIFGPDLSALSISGDPVWEGFYPPHRDGPSLIYDARQCRMIMFGGYNGKLLDDVWTLSLEPEPVWTRLHVPPGPVPRYLAAAMYDPVRERMVVYGGIGTFDAWALSLRGDPIWTGIQPQSFGPNDGQMVGAYVPSRDEFWLFGRFTDDVWYFSAGDNPIWQRVTTAGTAPGPGFVFYDQDENRIVACGSGVYGLSLGTIPGWTTLVPGAIDWSHGVFDPARDRFLIYHDPMRELKLRDASWTQVSYDGPLLSGLSYPAVTDIQNDRAVFYGSQDNSLRTLTWAPAESLDTTAIVWSDSVQVSDGAFFESTPHLVAGVPRVSCFDLASCVARLDGAEISVGAALEPHDALELTMPPLSRGQHQLDLRLVSDGVLRVIGNAHLTFTIVPRTDPLSLEDVAATPNPSRGSVRLGFRLTRPAQCTIDVFDIRGRRLTRLTRAGVAGWNEVQWNGSVGSQPAGTGCYLYRVTATDGRGSVRADGRALLLR